MVSGEAAAPDLLRLAARWGSGPEWRAAAAELDAEAVPSHLNTQNSSGLFHTVSLDKMSVQYMGSPQHGHDVGVVQADVPAPTRRLAYYFEMTVRNAGQKGQIAIGFTQHNFNMRRQPGWEANSCGYHGDDGYLYLGHGKGESFGPTFTSGDTIGAGINYASQEFFFTKNGKLVGTVCKKIKGPLYPTIAVHSQNEKVTVNFGKQPFLFDIEAFIWEEKLKQQMVIEKLSLPSNICHWLVRSYLLHYGYQDTLNSFDKANENACFAETRARENGFNDQGNTYELNNRKILRQLIKDGNIDSAFHNLQEWYPKVVQNCVASSQLIQQLALQLQDETSIICFLLHSQRFIEYVRDGHLDAAVNYARAELEKFFEVKPSIHLLGEIFALLAYDDPSGSCVGYLLDMSQREYVADAVNAVVLSTNPNNKDPENSLYSCLEKLLRQLTVCFLERRALNGDQGEAFYLHREVQTGGLNKL